MLRSYTRLSHASAKTELGELNQKEIQAHTDTRVSIGETFGAVFSSLRISKKHLYGPKIPKGRANVILSLEPMEALLKGYQATSNTKSD